MRCRICFIYPSLLAAHSADGNTYMAGLLQYPCGGTVQLTLLPLAAVTFVAYSIAVPAIAFWFLRSKRAIVKCGLCRWPHNLVLL